MAEYLETENYTEVEENDSFRLDFEESAEELEQNTDQCQSIESRDTENRKTVHLLEIQNEVSGHNVKEQHIRERNVYVEPNASLEEIDFEESEEEYVNAQRKFQEEPAYLRSAKSEIMPDVLAQTLYFIQEENLLLMLEQNEQDSSDSTSDSSTSVHLLQTETETEREMKTQTISSLTEELTAENGEEELVEETVEDEMSKESEFHLKLVEDDELLLLLSSDEEREKPIEKGSEDLIQQYLEGIETEIKKKHIKIDSSDYTREMTYRMKQLEMEARKFLNELITNVVEKCEYHTPENFLRKNLDKKQLMSELVQKLAELEVEQKARNYLNRRVGEYFRRRKKHSVFIHDDPAKITAIIQKYQTTLIKLDKALGREEKLNERIRNETDDLKRKFAEMDKKAKEKLAECEELIRTTFAKRGKSFSALVESQLGLMNKTNEEISRTRVQMIRKQHCNAALSEKLRQLDSISGNIQLQDYQSLLKEVQALGKRNEERNGYLVKTHERFNASTHKAAHTREVQSVGRHKLNAQKALLEEVQEQRKAARSYLTNLRTEHVRLRKEVEELRFQSMMVKNEHLLRDYDATEEKIKYSQDNIKELRKKHDEILRKITKLEKKC